MIDHRSSQSLTERRRNALWLTTWLLLAFVLVFAANWEANRQEQVRMDYFHSRVADLAKTSELIINEQIHQFDYTLLVLRSLYANDPKRFIESIGLLRKGPLADREILVVLVDRDGFLAYTDASTAKPGLYLGDRAYFRYFADGGKDRFYVDEPIFGRTTQRYSIPLVRPIYDKEGVFLGVIALSVRQDFLANFGTRLLLSEDTAITVVTQNGAVAGRSRDLAEVQGKIIPPEMLSLMLKGNEGIFSSRVIPDGVERVVAYRHIHDIDTPLIVYVEASPANVLHDMSRQRSVLMWGAAFTALVIMTLIIVYLKGRKTSVQLIDTLRSTKEQEYSALTQTSLDGFLVTDNSGRILDTNDTFCKMLGYERPELLNLSIMDFEADESTEQIADHIRTTMEAGSDRFQSQCRCKDGSIRDVEISVQYVKESGERFFVFVRDISERMQAEIVLRESRVLLIYAFNKSPLMETLSDLSTGTYLEVNDTFCRVSKFSREEVIGKTAIELGWISKDERMRMIQQVQQTGWANGMELSLRNKNGQNIIASYWGTVIHTTQGDRLFSTAEDITERKQAQEALQQKTEALRTSNVELELFNRAAVGRELRMIELKEEINLLCSRLGEVPRYGPDPLETDRAPAVGSTPKA
jgi:PAS domain S-box-containing protein